MVHCFFEQSSTFRDEFRKLGLPALDYDIQDSGKTDIIIDLFFEINKAYYNQKSIFDDITNCDLIFAFFPCTYFSSNNILLFSGTAKNLNSWNIENKLMYALERHSYLNLYYEYLCCLCLVCLKRNIPLIIENPHNNYLDNYFPIKPTVVDLDRTMRGDNFEKPTNYYFINCKPKYNIIFENNQNFHTKKVQQESGLNRSIISPEYAKNFIREFIL